MKTTNKKELSYFRLKLESYLSEHFPEKVEDKPFIKARADEALTTYCDAVEEGFSYPEAESMASEVLYRDLHFSKYDTLVSVLENEFEKELPSPLPERLAPILLKNRAIQETFDKYNLTDECIRVDNVDYPYLVSLLSFKSQDSLSAPYVKSIFYLLSLCRIVSWLCS